MAVRLREASPLFWEKSSAFPAGHSTRSGALSLSRHAGRYVCSGNRETGERADHEPAAVHGGLDLRPQEPGCTKASGGRARSGHRQVPPGDTGAIAAREDPDASVRRQVELALEEMDDIRVFPGSCSSPPTAEPDIRDRAVQALVNLHLPRATGPTAALAKLGSLINPWSDEYSDTVVEPDVPVDASVVTALRARMSDSEDGIRRHTSRGLGILRDEAAIPELLVAVGQDRDPDVRFEAVRALRKIGNASVGDRLLPILDLNVDRVRNEIITTLGSLRYRGAVPELTRDLRTGETGERVAPAGAVRARRHRRPRVAARCSSACKGRQGRQHPSVCQRRTGAAGRRVARDHDVGRSAGRKEPARSDGAGVRPAANRNGRNIWTSSFARWGSRRPGIWRESICSRRAPAQRPALFANRVEERHRARRTGGRPRADGDRSALPALQDLERDSDSDVARNAERAVRRITAGTHVE